MTAQVICGEQHFPVHRAAILPDFVQSPLADYPRGQTEHNSTRQLFIMFVGRASITGAIIRCTGDLQSAQTFRAYTSGQTCFVT